MKSRDEVVNEVGKWSRWLVKTRRAKFAKLNHGSMATNPFLAPVISHMHGLKDAESLGDFLLGGHLYNGYNTSFGKFVDEKVLPHVFGTVKLDKKFRKGTQPYTAAMFNDVDHLIPRDGGAPDLLSLKASRWTIQLGQARNLNDSFKKIIDLEAAGGFRFGRAVVGVFYGTTQSLTDKYEIVRGICAGEDHAVFDIQARVDVLAGSEFWSWLNDGEQMTQVWVLEGILEGFRGSGQAEAEEAAEEFERFRSSYIETLAAYQGADGLDWQRLLEDINRPYAPAPL